MRLTLEACRRNCIKVLFLSGGIVRNGDHTLEQRTGVACSLRADQRFAGDIHLETVPEASPELIDRAGRHADRLGITVEPPTDEGLGKLGPDAQRRHPPGHGARARHHRAIDRDMYAPQRMAQDVRRDTHGSKASVRLCDSRRR